MNQTQQRILAQLDTLASQLYARSDRVCTRSYQVGVLLVILSELCERDSDNLHRVVRTLNRMDDRNRRLTANR